MARSLTVLAMDTTLAACSVALRAAGRLAAHRFEAMERGQAERLVPMIAECMAEARLGFVDLDAIAVTRGPGTFTGIRIGLAAARALALACRKPLVGRTTLEVIAAGARRRAEGRALIAVIDARRGQVYAQRFAADATALEEPRACDPAAVAVALPETELFASGTGAARLLAVRAPARDRIRVDETAGLPDAADLARLVEQGVLPALGRVPEPLYLRPADAVPAAP